MDPTSLQSLLTLRNKHFEKHGFHPYRYQLAVSDQIIEAIARNLDLLRGATPEQIEEMLHVELDLEFSRQCGKTTIICHTVEFIMVWFPQIFEVSVEIGIFAPQKEQANTDFKRIKNLLMVDRRDVISVTDDEAKRAKEESNSRTITLGNGAMCFISPVTPASKSESKTFHLMIFEEAQDINDEIMKGDIWPMGASTNAPRVLIGTAGKRKCYFYERIANGHAMEIKWREVVADRRTAYEATGDSFHLMYEQFIKEEIKRYPRGEQDDDFRRPYNLEWILEQGMFITVPELTAGRILKAFEYPDLAFAQWYRSDVAKNLEDYARVHNLPPELVQAWGNCLKYPHFFGLDTAKEADKTVLKLGRMIDGKLTKVFSRAMNGIKYPDQFDILKGDLARFYVEAGAIDSTGQGDFMPDLFDRDTGYKIYHVKFTLMSKDHMYKSWYGRIVREQFAYYYQEGDPQSEDFEFETTNLVKEYKQNYMSIHHPDSAGAHDDHPDATALMNHAYDEYNGSSGVYDYYKEMSDDPQTPAAKGKSYYNEAENNPWLAINQ